ncbi:MAG: hypothetical protein Q9209_004944 [Squamulea sp. 1 TL-2023]
MPTLPITSRCNPRGGGCLAFHVEGYSLEHSLKLDEAELTPEFTTVLASKSVRKKRRRLIRRYQSIETARAAIIREAPKGCLAILATCRTILLEAFHLWYKNNTLNFASAQDLVAFLTSIGRVRAYEIRAVRLDIPAYEWDDPKARTALSRLLRLETVIFVYNDRIRNYTSPKHIGYPWIICNLQGLREVTFVDPPSSITSVAGAKQGMGHGQKLRMDQLRERMLSKRKHPRHLPPMMDLFSRLTALDHSKNEHARWKWNEESAYAPEVDGATLDMSSTEG